METEYVFLDTTEFVSASFNFDSARLKSIREKAENGSIKILTTDVVYREVENRIALYADEAHRKMKKLIQGEEFRTLRHLLPDVTQKVEEIDFSRLKEISKDKFDFYLDAARVEILSTDDVTGKEVLDLYFGKKAPFGEAKKKDEFPDAFSLAALKKWSALKGKKVYVISKDGDVKKVAELTPSFITTESSEAFLQTVVQHEQNKADFDAFIKLFSFLYTNELVSDVTKLVSKFEVTSSGFYEYVEFVDIEITHVDLMSSYLIDVNPEDVIVYVAADVTFSATAKFQDYSDASYDKEDNVAYGVREREEEIEDTLQVTGTLDYRISKFPPQQWEDIELEGGLLEPDPFDIDLEALLEDEE